MIEELSDNKKEYLLEKIPELKSIETLFDEIIEYIYFRNTSIVEYACFNDNQIERRTFICSSIHIDGFESEAQKELENGFLFSIHSYKDKLMRGFFIKDNRSKQIIRNNKLKQIIN